MLEKLRTESQKGARRLLKAASRRRGNTEPVAYPATVIVGELKTILAGWEGIPEYQSVDPAKNVRTQEIGMRLTTFYASRIAARRENWPGRLAKVRTMPHQHDAGLTATGKEPKVGGSALIRAVWFHLSDHMRSLSLIRWADIRDKCGESHSAHLKTDGSTISK